MSKGLDRVRSIGLLAVVETALFMSGVLAVLAPLPAILAWKRRGAPDSLAVTLLAGFLVCMLSMALSDPSLRAFSISSSVVALTGLSVVGSVIGHGLRKRWSFSSLLIRPIVFISVLGGSVMVLYWFGFRSGLTSFLGDLEQVAAQIQQRAGQLSTMEHGEPIPMIKQLQEIPVADLAILLASRLPLAVFWTISLVTWILVHAGIWFQLVREWRMAGMPEPTLTTVTSGSTPTTVGPELKGWIRLWKQSFLWRLPDHFIFPWMLTGALCLIPNNQFKDPAWVLFKILSTFYCFQGVSLVRFAMEYWRLPAILRMMIYLSVFFVPGSAGFFVLAGVGILDFWGDFRNKAMKLGDQT